MRKNWKWVVAMLVAMGAMTAFAACGQNVGPSMSDSTVSDSPVEETKHTVTFKAGDVTVATKNYTDDDMTIDEPAVPEKAHYTGVWETYILDGNDITVNAIYTPIEYTVVFKVDGEEVGSDTYTVENTEIDVPSIAAKDHYTSAWESYTLTGGSITVNAVYTPIDYTITFMNGEDKAGEVVFNIEDNDKQAPIIPEKTGYTGAWSEYSFETLANQTSSLSYTPNTYTITYDALGGTASVESQDVIYDGEYTLATATPPKSYQEFLGWVDENGNTVNDGDAWEIAKSVTLKAVYSKGITFESLTAVPSALTTDGAAGTASIGEKDGDKCLVIPVTGSSPKLKVTLAFLAEFFADENVQYVGFDATTDTTVSSDFRRYTLRSTGALGNETYEHNDSAFGVTKLRWKSFYFTRADYNTWVENNFSEHYFIITGGFSNGDNLYVDNIRPVTAQEYLDDVYSFEGGYMKQSGTNLLVYTNVGAKGTWQLGIGFNDNAYLPTAYGLTSDMASQGANSFYFTKPANSGDYTVRLNDVAFTTMKSTGYYAFDLYVPEGADATLLSGDTSWTVATPKAGAWTTIYVCSTNSKPVNIHDTTGGTYAIDHFRSVTKEEFDAAKYGFEAGAGALRTDVLESENRLYYYAGADNQDKKISLNVKGDGSTLSNVRMDMENVHSGKYALAFEKTNGYVFMSLANTSSAMYEELKNGFTFWIYSTVALNGEGEAKNFINGKNEQFGEDGVSISANMWTKVTITADDIDGSGRFLILDGSTAGTIYLDDICPLAVE
ncbi:MAG: InlB B-repeat-containing protein [Clostridia bacterium]|nr:InlB B-repeat-containing protein [Clostridia bacterium]